MEVTITRTRLGVLAVAQVKYEKQSVVLETPKLASMICVTWRPSRLLRCLYAV